MSNPSDLANQPIELADIQRAMGRIRKSIPITPLVYSAILSKLTGNEIFLKLENLQMTGSFKERGALNRILLMTPDEQRRGVIAASAGNHAQAVAYHATQRGIRSQIVMPITTPIVKAMRTQEYGAEVILHGSSFDEALAEAYRRRDAEDLMFLHAFNDREVIAGQGTLGIEMLEQVPDLDAIVAPIGGGGLLGGIAVAAKAIKPEIRMIGVEAARVPSMLEAVREGKPVTVPAAATIADGIAVRRAGEWTLPLIQKYVDELVTVEEEEIASAILLLLEREKTLAEGSGAAAIAALLNFRTELKGKQVGVLVCGGNIDVSMLSRIIERGMVRQGRLVRMRFEVADHPGSLQGICAVLAANRANVVELIHDRSHYGVGLGNTSIDITFETRGGSHVEELEQALDAAGYRHSRVQ